MPWKGKAGPWGGWKEKKESARPPPYPWAYFQYLFFQRIEDVSCRSSLADGFLFLFHYTTQHRFLRYIHIIYLNKSSSLYFLCHPPHHPPPIPFPARGSLSLSVPRQLLQGPTKNPPTPRPASDKAPPPTPAFEAVCSEAGVRAALHACPHKWAKLRPAIDRLFCRFPTPTKMPCVATANSGRLLGGGWGGGGNTCNVLTVGYCCCWSCFVFRSRARADPLFRPAMQAAMLKLSANRIFKLAGSWCPKALRS